MDVRNLVYKLCEGREVPLLVTDIIAGYLVHRDLFNINTLSRSLNAQANAIIYREVIVDLDGTDRSVKKAILLFRTLLTSETAARAVHTLSLAGDPLESWRTELQRVTGGESIEKPLCGKTPPAIHADLVDFTRGEIQLYDNVAASSFTSVDSPTSVWGLYLTLLRFAPNIQNFSVSSDYFRFREFRDTLQSMAQDPSIKKMRSCSLCLDLLKGIGRHAHVVRDWDSALLSVFALQYVESITAVVALKPDAVRQLHPSGPGAASITRLDLHHYQIQDADLSSLLAATPKLRYLKYHACSDYAWLGSPRRSKDISEHGIGLEPLYGALHRVCESLQELHIFQEVDEDSYHYEPGFGIGYEPLFSQTAKFSSLERLHTLTIPYMALLGCAGDHSNYGWDNILPSSLRRIVLNDDLDEIYQDEPWTDENLMPVFTTLVEWLSTAERGDEVPEFGLHLAQLDYEFNEPVRRELSLVCERNGVRCSIEKALADSRRYW
jgi:hypothetical protein